MSDTDRTHDVPATQADGTETPPSATAGTASRQTYVTTKTLRHDGADYPPGSPIELDDERAGALLKAGTVKRHEPD